MSGRETIKQMVLQAKDRIVIMAGGGVTEKNASDLIEYTQIREIHGTGMKSTPGLNCIARDYVDSGMTFRKPGVFMGGEKVFDYVF